MNLKLFNPKSLACLALVAVTSMSIFAAEPPKRKSGLWETTMQAQGMPNMGPMQQCVDQPAPATTSCASVQLRISPTAV